MWDRPSVVGTASMLKFVVTSVVMQVINSYIVFLYHAISMLSPLVGFNISLNRFDLFHGHMFTTYDTNRLGIL